MHKSSPATSHESSAQPAAPGLLRRLAAIIYDGLLLIALLAIVSLPFVMQVGEQSINSNPLLLLVFRLIHLLTMFLFFGWFWTHGGQTLGMRAWRLRAEKIDGTTMDWRASLKRFFAALLSWLGLGLGYLWILVDKDKMAWHDRLSGTRLVLIERKKR